jgi:hypothetical protein
MIYAINYDLHAPNRDYSGLYKAIKDLGTWWHHLESTWLVDTKLNATEIWAKLQSHVDKNDSMLIIRVAGDKNGWLPQEAWDWINSRLQYAA